jgi:hypothetical protein
MMNRVFRIIKRYPLSLVVIAAILYLSFFKPPKQDIIHVSNLDKFVLHSILVLIIFCYLERSTSPKKSGQWKLGSGSAMGDQLRKWTL